MAKPGAAMNRPATALEPLRPRWQEGAGTAKPAGALLVSVVVPTYKRPQLLQRCLRALAAQSLPRADFEVIVVDDGHSDSTQRVVSIAAAQWPPGRLRYLRPLQGRGPAVARNCGWSAARAALVAFTDDDTLPSPDWLAQGVRAMRNKGYVALGGRVVVPRPESRRPPQAPTDHERMTRGLESARFVTANAFVRRSALTQVHGFDERFRRAWREDSDLEFRLERQVGPVGRCEDAVVLHPVREEPWGLSLRQQKNVYFDALLYRKHPRLYRQRVRQTPPWDYYAIVALTLGGIIAALAGQLFEAGIAAALVLALVLRFALRRLAGASHSPRHVTEMLVTSALIPYLSVAWRLRGAWHFRTWFL
jgi:glycosyltransferase involved in cell wall biosynthesis